MNLQTSCIILSGPSGSGKSSIAKHLWRMLPNNPAYLNLDSIKHLPYGAESTDHFLDLARINALDLTRNFLESNHSVIVDKAFGSYRFVKPFIDLSNSLCIQPFYFKLYAPINELISRVESRRNYSDQMKLESGEWPLPTGNRSTAEAIYKFFMENEHSEGIQINTSEKGIEEVVREVMGHLEK